MWNIITHCFVFTIALRQILESRFCQTIVNLKSQQINTLLKDKGYKMNIDGGETRLIYCRIVVKVRRQLTTIHHLTVNAI